MSAVSCGFPPGRLVGIQRHWAIDPLHVCGNAANLEDETKEIFASVKNILLFCTPDWLHSHRRARGL